MNLEKLIKEYQEQALQIDLKKDVQRTVSNAFFGWKNLLDNAEFENEVKQVLDVAESAVTSIKNLLIKSIQNESYKMTTIGRTPDFIIYLRMYLEYKELYLNAYKKQNTKEAYKKIENPGDASKTYDKLWFKSGLFFADGTMDQYWNKALNGIKEPYSAPDVADAVNLRTADKYILAVFNDYKTDKNLFNSMIKINTIIDYCKDKGITISDVFTMKHQQKLNDYK